MKKRQNTKTGNMYQLSVAQWNPFVGCGFDCSYCKPSFQRQAKRQKQNCYTCYEFKPHEHPTRLMNSLPRTGFGQFIFTCCMGDVAFCKTPYLQQIVDRIAEQPNKTFLIQSKSPETFSRVRWPQNVILGTTIETNRDNVARAISKAPVPSERYKQMMALEHPLKMVTVEPALAFDVRVMEKWILDINPVMVWLGYDSKNTGLAAPSHMDFKVLHWALASKGMTVILKKVSVRS